MAQLTSHVSGKTAVLELLFPNGAWKELFAAIAWEMADAMFRNGGTFKFKRWFVSITVPQWVFEAFLTAMFGPRNAE